ncbi:Uncharacterised protein [Legionella hackeliae]|uniref:Uncharacterized protein n=1 Tax=Legionella hackeliae TaxID=449 RepID=A0A0A8UQB8_LEGHA|nr:protein of unknown function [Legionella hackeliae]STX49189.1 Uncharacterised protein [Legionella hackeliae]
MLNTQTIKAQLDDAKQQHNGDSIANLSKDRGYLFR